MNGHGLQLLKLGGGFITLFSLLFYKVSKMALFLANGYFLVLALVILVPSLISGLRSPRTFYAFPAAELHAVIFDFFSGNGI